MKNKSNQLLNTKFLETENSVLTKIISFFLIFIFLTIPLYEIVPELIDCSCPIPESNGLISNCWGSNHPCGYYYW